MIGALWPIHVHWVEGRRVYFLHRGESATPAIQILATGGEGHSLAQLVSATPALREACHEALCLLQASSGVLAGCAPVIDELRQAIDAAEGRICVEVRHRLPLSEENSWAAVLAADQELDEEDDE